eukprot:8609989-Lingulodinium_polyedra.AAC.1
MPSGLPSSNVRRTPRATADAVRSHVSQPAGMTSVSLGPSVPESTVPGGRHLASLAPSSAV